MKKTYTMPQIYVEEFVANRAIAACDQKKVVFDCMMGPNTDTTNVITSADSCINQAGVSTATVAIHNTHNRGWGHSNGSGGSWEKSANGWKYTAPSDAKGLLYICSKGLSHNTSAWTSGTTLTHSATHTGQWHCQIAPVYNVSDVVVGS